MLKCGIQMWNTIICIYILYEFCIQIVYTTFMMFFLSELIYTKFIQNSCVPTFRQTCVYILYTKFKWNGSFNFVRKMYTKICRNGVHNLYTFCIHFAYISCIHLVQFLYTKCIHNFRVGSI